MTFGGVVLGCGNFGGVGSAPEFFGQGISEDEAYAIMDRAWANGIHWFDTGDAMKSFAFLPLRTAYTFGLLGLGDKDPERFHPGMGTVYLTRLAELASVATARYLPPA